MWLERMGKALVSVPLGSSLMDQHAHVSSTMLYVVCCMLYVVCVLVGVQACVLLHYCACTSYNMAARALADLSHKGAKCQVR